MHWNDFHNSTLYTSLPPGQLYIQDEKCLLETARGRVAEIGCLMGRSASIMAIHADTVTTIDIFDQYDLIADPLQREHYKDLVKLFPHDYTTIKNKLEANKKITVLAGTSDILPTLGEFNYIFLDGDHSYEGVKRDYINARKALAPNGRIAFHDSNIEEPGMGVYKLMAELKKDSNLELTPYIGGGVITLLKVRE